MKRKIILLTIVGIFTLALVDCSSTKIITKDTLLLQETIEIAEKELPITQEEIANVKIDENVVVTLEVTEEPQPIEPPIKETTTAIPTEKVIIPVEPTQTLKPVGTPTPTTEPVSTPQSAITPEPVVTPTSTPQPTPEPAFDVNYWVEFGKSYGQSIGLQLDSSVTGSWDTPIGANAKCIYLERDIKDALNWYKNDYGFEYFWIWTEEIGENRYNIYIGYA